MNRFFLVAAALTVAAGSVTACAAAFKDRRTPSGDFCSDMPIIPAGQDVDREYHRLQPIQSDPKARTEAERLESLRKVACQVGGDAVIEAVNEEVRGENAQYQMVSSGTAVIWLRRAGTDVKPLTPSGLPTKKAAASADAATTAAPTADASPPPPPSASASASAKAGTGKPQKSLTTKKQ